MSRKLPIILTSILILFGLVVYVAYDIYKAVSPDSLCIDECSKQGCDNHTFYNCTKEINNCYYKVYQELEVGLCDAECLTSDDCNESLKCINNECKEPTCGDDSCDKDAGETCSTCLKDCPIEGSEICCFGKIVEGKCCSTSDCKGEYEVCEDYNCVIGPYCGDGTCDKDENCDTCKKDCKPSESEVCCTGIIKTGDCCKDSQCEDGYDCKKNKCTAIPTP